MDKQDLLLEIGCEELPPKSLQTLAESLAYQIDQGLQQAELTRDKIESFATPRRLGILIKSLSNVQPERNIERRGPALAAAFDQAGQPTPACQGFAKSCGVSVADLVTLTTDKGSWLVYRQQQAGKTTAELLPAIIQQAVANLPIAKTMRWGASDIEFVRPVHWIVLLHGQTVVPAEILGKRSDRISYGHRFLQPQAIVLNSADDYLTSLRRAYVEPDFKARRTNIQQQLAALAQQQAAKVLSDEKLLDEVTSIVEWPKALLCNFNANFLKLPTEVIVTALQAHQKCFLLADSQDRLLAHFIAVANIESRVELEVIKGNEKVVTARLADAAFFYQTDCAQPLDQQLERLKQVVFQEKLGSLYDKAQRLAKLMESLAKPLQVNQDLAMHAGRLAKTDLLTQMVGEFPELQGIMGYYYAKQQGLDKEIAVSLKEQYLPRFAGDELPMTQLGCGLALADRLDTLAGLFAAGEIPTGDKDPFGLRRAALGIVRILLEKQFNLGLNELIKQALTNYQTSAKLIVGPELALQIQKFMLERLRAWYLEKGISADILQAVFAKQLTVVSDIHRRVQAVAGFRTMPEALALAAANKRVSNLLDKQAVDTTLSVDEGLLQEPAERDLFKQLCQVQALVEPLYSKGEYSLVMQHLAKLRQVVDNFFDQVMVMVEDPKIRQNRLVLLANLRHLFLQVADISLLQ
jgi:glycyl-tRNA synthetase beta chain